MRVRTISPEELDGFRREGRLIDLIDVRTPVEYRAVHAEGARSVPLDALDPAKVMAQRDGDSPAEEPVYLICQSGSRSSRAVGRFAEAGFHNAVSVEGGTLGWERAGLPVVRGKKSISLERQVRIAAGSLVLLGTILGFLVHPAFLGVAGFVGAGLIFAGVTDTCGMGLVLSKMPWNQADESTACTMANEAHP